MWRRFACAVVCSLLTGFAQDLSDLRIERIASGFRFAEGPVWSRDGYLVVSDIPVNRIVRLAMPATEGALSRSNILRAESGGAIGNAFDAQGRLYTCESHARRVTRTDKKGKVDVLADQWQGKKLNSPNDIVVRRDGHVYFTDPAFGSAVDARELSFYGIFHITPKGEVSVVAKWQSRPNGITLSPDGRSLYVANSDEHSVRLFDLDKAGEATGERNFVTGIKGVPDGLRMDENGNLYVAANGILIYKPDGSLFGEIPFADTPSNCAFGGEDFRTLFVTARNSVYLVHVNVKGSVQY